MSTKAKAESNEPIAGGVRSEPAGRAQRPAGGPSLEIPDAVRDRLSDEVIDELLAGARTEEEKQGEAEESRGREHGLSPRASPASEAGGHGAERLFACVPTACQRLCQRRY
jgi:hypothetical protein